MGASQSLSGWHSWIFFHHLPSHTWKLPSYITHHNLISEVSTHNKINFFLLEIKITLNSFFFLKISKKFLQRKSKLKVWKMKKRQNRTESVKDRPADSKEFFRDTSATQIKNSEHTKVSWLYRACFVKISAQKDEWDFSMIFPVTRTKSVFWTACHNFHFPCHMRI